MARNSYVPGEWYGIVRSGTVVVLGPDTGRGLIDSLWALLERGPEIHEVLNEVTEGFGVSLTRIPAFGIVEAKDALRVVLRGDLDLDIGHGPSAAIHGRDVTTWAERRMELPESYRLRIGAGQGAGSDHAGAAALPLEEGVVLLSGFDAVFLAGETPKAAAEPVPAEPISDIPGSDIPTAASAVAVDAAGTDAAGTDTAAAGNTDEEPAVVEAAAPAPGESEEEDRAAEAVTPAPEPAGSGETIIALEPEETGEPEQEESQDDLELTIAPGQLRDDATEGDKDEQGTGDGGAAPGADVPGADVPGAPGAAVPEEVLVDTGSTTDEMVQNLEQTSSYDHLWERTVIRNIEDAAVRENPDEDHGEAEPQLPPAEAAPEAPAPAGPAPADQAFLPPSGNQPEARPQLPPPAAPQAPASQSPGLISSVPWLSGNSAPAQQPQPPAPQGPVPPQQWLPPASPAAPAGYPGETDEDSDHDGHTIMKSSLANLAQNPAPAAPAAGEQRGGDLLPDGTKRPLVLARVCPQGHANPPTYSQCQSCGTGLSGDGVQVPRPSLGRVRLSTGEVIELDRSLIIGRQPSVSRVQGGGMPALVQVESPGGDISRSHVEVRLEGWHVMLCDLKATNGTVLVREGQPPRRLAQSEMAIVLDGDIAELGDNISLRFEEIL